MAHAVKFWDRHGRERTGTPAQAMEEQNAYFAHLRNNAAALERTQVRMLDDAKRAKVRAFRDEMTGVGRDKAFMTPAQFDAQESLLLACDDVAVRKFADGKATGSALEESFDRLRKAYAAPVRRFNHESPAGGGTPGGSALTPEKRAEMLKATNLGRAALALQKK